MKVTRLKKLMKENEKVQSDSQRLKNEEKEVRATKERRNRNSPRECLLYQEVEPQPSPIPSTVW